VKILLSNATDIFAGGEDYVLILARYLKQRGHSVWVSALPDHMLLRKCTDSGLETVPIDYRGMFRVFAVAAQLRKAMLDRSIEVVHSNANYDRTCAAIATAFTRIRHVAGVHSTHSIQHNITHWLRNKWGIDHFITDADAGKEVLVSEDAIPTAKITTVPIGIESDLPEFREAARRKSRVMLGAQDGTIVIGNVARLVPFKGHRCLLETVAAVVQKEHNVIFPIVGDGELMSDLRQQAKSLGIDDTVMFLGFREDLREIYPAFDMYCHSSLDLAAEMFPIAILRALAAGLPVVCTNVGGIAHMVRDGVSGYLVNPDDPSALARALLRVINDRNLRQSMGAASFDLFKTRYHASAMAERIEHVYLRLLNR
jgi:glycosyltransferase involved in cell wall biosynthesis